MKILPDYLIQYMPLLEEAMEELRLSVIDHAYDLLKCLDIDELSSDDIRKKLELYHIKLENMTSYWLPNGKFYRVYPLIKHNRTRYNAIQSIVKSGGQFEGLWSDEFSTRKELDYSDVQLMRHYQIKSDLDGYFFVSGDATRNKDGTIKSSVITALATDALLEQALPSGYTYLYIPWPRPLYPTDSNYFYNIFALQYDRLHYAVDCDNHNSYYYDLSIPASTYYYNNETRRQSPYWYDYHYITNDKSPYKTYWPIEKFRWDYYDSKGELFAYTEAELNSNKYYDYTVYEIDTSLDIPTSEEVQSADKIKSLIDKAVRCELHTSDEYNDSVVLDDSNSYFITKCFLQILEKWLAPNRAQGFTPEEPVYNITINSYDDTRKSLAKDTLSQVLSISENKSDVDYILNEINSERPFILSCSTYTSAKYVKETLANDSLFTVSDIEDGKIARSIDEDYMKSDHVPSYMFGPYRYDYLAPKYRLQVFENRGHFKTYRPLWDTSSTIFGISQSCFKTSLEGYSSQSMMNIFKLKQDNNIPTINEDSIYGESFIRNNIPPVSEVTFTSFDRPVYGRLDPVYTAFFSSSNTDQSSNVTLDNDTSQNHVYEYNSSLPIKYDPKLYYTVISLGSKSNLNSQEIIDSGISLYIEGDPVTNNLYINKNNQAESLNEITYKTSLIHKLWFKDDHSNLALLNTNEELEKLMYNRAGSSEDLYYSANNVEVVYKILGVYSEDGTLISKDDVSLNCAINRVGADNKYITYYTTNKSITASYILFTLDVKPGSVPVIEFLSVQVYLQSAHENTTTSAIYKPSSGIIKVDGMSEFITLQEFYNMGYIIVDGSATRYYGSQEISLYYDEDI